MLLRDAIGSTLRRLRLEQGRTLRDLARDSAVSLPYLSEIERGRKEASSEILATLSRALEVPLDIVLHEVSERLEQYEVVALPVRNDDAVLLAA